MKHLIKKENNIIHGTLGWSHNGKDGQYCEAGETVRIKWQPNAGWGLKEVHYTDGDGNVVAIEGGEFVMPDSAVVIGATFKRFFLNDWADNPYNPKPELPPYLTFTAGAGGASVGFIVNYVGDEIPEDYTKPSLQYSTDGGKTWQEYDLQISDIVEDATVIELAEGKSVMFKGVNNYLSYYIEDMDVTMSVKAYIVGNVAANGDVTSLLNGVGGDVAVPRYCYNNMFGGCTGLTQAPALPATTLADYCYSSMFGNCTGLTQAPALPATTLESNCYDGMFYGCTGLTQAPALPATTLADGCYSSMFGNCTGLTSVPELPATTLADYCYYSMFINCTGLTSVPALPATTLADGCYSSMFGNCTGLTQVHAMPATTLADGCYDSMFFGCTGITSYDVATLNNSSNIFLGNSSCASLTIHADTPPTIANNTITGLKVDCIIYVPAASVDAYKAAQYWSARSAYIQAIQ